VLASPAAGQERLLLDLLENRVPPGVDPAAKVKADFLGRILKGKKNY
jgi:aconitate hydratase 2/2-methylisocitrate dehydratase